MRHRRQIGPVRLIASCIILIALIPIVGYFTYLGLSTGEVRLPERDGGVVAKASAPLEYWLWISGHFALLLFLVLKVPEQIRRAQNAITR